VAEFEPVRIGGRRERVPDTSERLHILTPPDFLRRGQPDASLLRRELSVAPVAGDLVRQLGALSGIVRLSQAQEGRAIGQVAETVDVDRRNAFSLCDVEEIHHGEVLLDRPLVRVHEKLLRTVVARLSLRA
jgi:hypothetical protein